MGKVSIFKFNVNSQNSEYAKNMIGNYLNTRGFKYNGETNYFETPMPNSKQSPDGNNIVSIHPGQRGFEYTFIGNELTIKSYIIDPKKKRKLSIHNPSETIPAGNEYMADLKINLFKSFEARFISKISTTEEETKDGSGSSNISKIVFIILGLLVLGFAIAFIFLMK